MQLSYNLIRGEQTLNSKNKSISTEYNKKIKNETIEEEIIEEEQTPIQLESSSESLYKINEMLIEDGRKERERIIVSATQQAIEIEKEAYEKGYALGRQNGYEDGHREIIDHILPDANSKAEEIINQASQLLHNAQKDYENYLDSKKEDILKLSLSIAEKILKSKVQKDDGITLLLEEGIALSKGVENLIIKCNPIYENDIKKAIPSWKVKYSIKGDIFLLPSETIPKGDGIIEKDNGSITIGLSYGLEELEKALFT